MSMLSKAFSCLLLAASAAAALEKEFVDQMVQSSQNLERDAASVSRALRTKTIDPADVTNRIEAMNADIVKLRELVQQFDATHPELSERDRSAWRLLKDKVHIIEAFHGQKKSMANADIDKNRSSIRALADGVALRAKKLQQSAAILRRG
ncbi:MAG: hypothetical protein ACKV2U_09040 [Bryobacteraceae bacterium]